MAIVYFIQAGPIRGEGMIKIGIASDLRRRLNNLQVGCPDDLNVIEAIEFGSRAAEIEKLLHQVFAPLRRFRSEWFAPHPHLYVVARHLRCLPEATRLGASIAELAIPPPPRMVEKHFLLNRNVTEEAIEEHW